MTKHLLAGAVAMLASGSAAAMALTDEFSFITTGQSMWKEGGAAVFKGEAELVSQWGNFDGGSAQKVDAGGFVDIDSIPNPDYAVWKSLYEACRLIYSSNTCINGRKAKKVWGVTVISKVEGLGDAPPKSIDTNAKTGVKATLTTSGEAGFITWLKASGGSVDASLAVKTKVTLPDAVVSGQAFTVNTEITVDKNKVAITARAPDVTAGLDGIVNMTNTFSIQGCILSGCDSDSSSLNLKAGGNGRFGLIGFDSINDAEHPLRLAGKGEGTGNIPDFKDSYSIPGVLFGTNYPIYYPTHDDFPLSPRLGDVTLYQLEDFTGKGYSLKTNQDLLSLNLSLTGMAEYSFNPPDPGILSNTIVFKGASPSYIPDPKLRYTLLDIGIGPRIGVQQEFDLDPDAWVRLEFDRPVTRVSDGKVFDDGIVEVQLGKDVDLRFDGEAGNLVRRTFFMKDTQFSNETSATIDPGMKIEAGCISLTGVLDYECAFIEDYKTTDLLDISIYDKEWMLAGFNEYSVLGLEDSKQIPLPATGLLFAAGLLGLAFVRRRAA